MLDSRDIYVLTFFFLRQRDRGQSAPRPALRVQRERDAPEDVRPEAVGQPVRIVRPRPLPLRRRLQDQEAQRLRRHGGVILLYI